MRAILKIFTLSFFVLGFTNFNPSKATDDFNGVEQKIRFIQCYPNPATSNINFEFSLISDKSYVLSVYNFIGKKVDEIKINTSKINLNLDNYFRGLYVYQLRDKQGSLIESGKFQVVK